jgi:hypothetical protein
MVSTGLAALESVGHRDGEGGLADDPADRSRESRFPTCRPIAHRRDPIVPPRKELLVGMRSGWDTARKGPSRRFRIVVGEAMIVLRFPRR